MNLYIALICIFAAVAIISTTALIRVYMSNMKQIQDENRRLLSEVTELKIKVFQLENQRPKTIGQSAYLEFMNGLTALAQLDSEIEFAKSLLQNAVGHFSKVTERKNNSKTT
jgi:hypothetical protein